MKETQFMKAYTIKEVSRQINVPSGTIRQWEKDLEGLLIIPRTRQGARFYTEQEIELLAKIKQMRSKNLSKDMIRDLLQKHISLGETANESLQHDTLPAVIHGPAASQPAIAETVQQGIDIEELLKALNEYKAELISDVRREVRQGIRTEVIDELRKEVASGSLQTIKALSLSINRSKEKMKEDLEQLSRQVASASEQSSEHTAKLEERLADTSTATEKKIGAISFDINRLSRGTVKELSAISQNVTKVSTSTKKEVTALKENIGKLAKGTTKEISTLNNNVAKLSQKTTEELAELASLMDESAGEFKILADYISRHKEMTVAELNTLNEQLAMDRDYYLETIKLERDAFRGEIQRRDDVFKGMVEGFREAAAARPADKKWWKPWKRIGQQ